MIPFFLLFFVVICVAGNEYIPVYRCRIEFRPVYADILGLAVDGN